MQMCDQHVIIAWSSCEYCVRSVLWFDCYV